MPTCRSCCGQGFVTYEEEDREVRDDCYHCGTTGNVDEDADFADRLTAMANAMAYKKVSEYKKARDTGDAGFEEDFAFCAAENMMTEYDYFRTLVWDEQYKIMDELVALPKVTLRVMLASHEHGPIKPANHNNIVIMELPKNNKPLVFDLGDDNIPF